MTRLLLACSLAVCALAVPVHAAPDTPVKLVPQPNPCPAGYYELGWVGVEGAKWTICQKHPIT